MATIISAQSGYWDDPTTWVGGVVPDLYTDDVVVADYHTVTADGSSLTLANGRLITIESDGMLELGTQLTVESGATVYVHGGLHVYAYIEVQGYLQVDTYGWVDDYGGVAVLYGGTVDAGGSVYVGPYSYFDVVYGSSLYIYGWFYQDWNAYSHLYQGAYVSIESSGSAYFDGYLHVEEYSALHVYGDADFSYGGSAAVRYGSELYVEWGGSLIVRNYLNVVDSAYLYVNGDLTLDGYLYVYGGSQVYVEHGGTLTINGYMTVKYYSTLTVYYDGKLMVSRYGGLEVYYDGSIYFDYLSRSDLFGYFRLSSDAYLYLGPNARVLVYRDVNISGRMESGGGGGKIVMLRREGRINDADGESLFVFDRAYGHGLTLVA
ncbi:MAG: hypothetical protein AMXMBFR83_27960 [Phycisphaerae bacterium]